MTKKHFIHAAKLISCIPNMEEKIAAARVFYQVAESDNPNFDRERFLAACGLWQIGAGIKQKAFK